MWLSTWPSSLLPSQSTSLKLHFFYKRIYTHAWITNIEILTLYCNNNTEVREEKKCKPQEHKVALHMMENWYTNRSPKIDCSDWTNTYINTLQLSRIKRVTTSTQDKLRHRASKTGSGYCSAHVYNQLWCSLRGKTLTSSKTGEETQLPFKHARKSHVAS